MKKVLLISSSLRLRSNSEALADEFARGASDAGNEVEKITLREKRSVSAKVASPARKRSVASSGTMLGVIINITSVNGERPLCGGAYTATKGPCTWPTRKENIPEAKGC